MDLTRGQFLQVTGSGVLGALLPVAPAWGSARAASSPGYMAFQSRRDLRPPVVTVTSGRSPEDEGYLFLGPTGNGGAQAGAMIIDATGQLVWFHPVARGQWVTNFQVQQYAGAPVLAWWEGEVDAASGYGRGSGVILDTSYRMIRRIQAANGRQADLHELRLTPEGTVLLTCYPDTVRADLSGVGGPRNGRVLQSVIQEIDIHSGRLLFEWRSLEHIPVSETYFPPWGLCDYLHANSIDLTSDGHLLVSARHTSAVYKLHRRTGRVLWRLGGKRSQFAMRSGTRFAWQHDARVQPGSRITLFDDGAGPRKIEAQSRGLVLSVDHAARTVSLVRAFRHPQPILAYAMGNMQLLADGSVILGWGNYPGLSQFSSDGSLATDLRLPWGHASYRAFRLRWSGTPGVPPALAAGAAAGSTTLYASWNGATEAAAWQLYAGPAPAELSPVGITQRTGFETTMQLSAGSGYAAVTALDSAGRPLARSRTLAL